MEKERKCKICNNKLSRYNFSDQCFHHNHEKDYDGEVAESSTSRCASRVCDGILIVDFQYNGKLKYYD